jgi:hypothetical protein
MKKHVNVALLSLFLTVSTLQAQSKFELGLRIIPQATTFRYSLGLPEVSPALGYLKLSPYDFRVRSSQGIGIVYNPVQLLRLGADLMYSLQGGGYKERKTNLSYLNLPLWLGFNSKASKKLIFTIQSGVQLSCLLSAKNKFKDGTTTDISRYVSRFSWGVPLAVGLKFKVAQTYFITTQVYVYTDFSPIAKTNPKLGVYNYVYPGIRICIDQNFSNFKKKK